MFINLFHALRRQGVPVTFDEWLALQEALGEDLAGGSLTRFYHLARATLVKTEAHFDRFDRAFLDCFSHIGSEEGLLRRIEERLAKAPPLGLTDEEKRLVEALELDEVRKGFLDRLRNQDDRPHTGGKQAVGTHGRSPYGAWGYNPAGVRLGQDESRHRRAVQIAERRSFRNYRDDVALDVRGMKTALGLIRQAVREGPKECLDVEGTVRATCRNAGELEFVWERARRKRIKLLLLMDAGGTMEPHAELVERLFSAAKDVVKDLRSYYFHNCVYQDLYTDIRQMRSVPTRKVLEAVPGDYKVIFVGDASMAPGELLHPNGAIDFWYENDRPGIDWLTDIRNRFSSAVWLNPDPARWWDGTPTVRMVRALFPMFELTLEGVRAGARALMRS